MTKLTKSERRAIAFASCSVDAKKYGAITELGRRYGVSHSRVYQIRDEMTDPDKLAELKDEVAVRERLLSYAKAARH